jgi:hypothetical protein
MRRIETVAVDTPFSERVWESFGYPLRGAALATCVALALAHYVGLLPSFIGVFAKILIWTATWRYAAICMLHTAHGYADPPDVGVDGNDSSGWGLTAIHLLAVAMCVLAVVFFPHAFGPLLIFFAVFLPAIDMSLAFDGNMVLALNPANGIRIIRGFGAAYLIPVGINLLLGIAILVASIATAFMPILLALPLFAFAYTYLIILSFHLMGAMIHQRHERFGITLESEILVKSSGQDADQQLLGEVDELARHDPQAAISRLVSRLQDRSAPATLHVAYRKLLQQQGLRDALLVHGQIWIAAMMANNEARRALGLVQECSDIDPAFIPDDPDNAGTLADLAARMGMSRLAVRLCQGCLASWPRAPDAPRLALLAAQLMADKLNQSAEAKTLIAQWIQAWPHHPLRDEADVLALRLQSISVPS